MEDLLIFGIFWLVPGLLTLALLLFGLALYGWIRQRKIDAESERMRANRMQPEDELKTLGIVSVRQLDEQQIQKAPESANGARKGNLAAPASPTDSPPGTRHAAGMIDARVEEDRLVEGDDGVPRFSPKRTVAPVDDAESVSVGRHPGTYLDQGSLLWHPSHPMASPDAVAFLLESLWAAMNAQSVALLRFDGETSSYGVDALVSERVTRQISLFPADGNLLNLVQEDGSISILEPDAFTALRYHANPMISVGHAVAISVLGPRERVLLVADVEPGAEAFSTRSLDRFGEYADLLAGLLPKAECKDTPNAEAETDHKPTTLEDAIGVELADRHKGDSEALAALIEKRNDVSSEEDVVPHNIVFDALAAVDEAKLDIKVPTFDPPEADNGSPRSRNDIIAEEMTAARQTQEPLALALVVPRNAVEVSTQGSRAIKQAEQHLMERLRGVAGSARVELFGELVVGVFCHVGPAFVEAWVERVEHSGPDVQIGVALLRARHHTPEAFRSDAEDALREAYERKEECVIVD